MMRYRLTIDYDCPSSPGTWDYQAPNAKEMLACAMGPLSEAEVVRFTLEREGEALPVECLCGEELEILTFDHLN